jgi:hypothetical protein
LGSTCVKVCWKEKGRCGGIATRPVVSAIIDWEGASAVSDTIAMWALNPGWFCG